MNPLIPFSTYLVFFVARTAAQGACPVEIGCGDTCDVERCMTLDGATCECLPDHASTCPAKSLFTINRNCETCEDGCVVQYPDPNEDTPAILRLEIQCGCAEKPLTLDPDCYSESHEPSPRGCEPAYDNVDYCKCSGPRPYAQDASLQEISVCGDATYLLPIDALACAGPADQDPAGTVSPKQGDTCRPEILSYLTGNSTGTCIAPEDATCVRLNTGAWGCVFPGNCNTINRCTDQPACTDEYETNDDGTCTIGGNGYPVPAEGNTALIDTQSLTHLQADTAGASAVTSGVMTLFFAAVLVAGANIPL